MEKELKNTTDKMKEQERGITLIALIVTIVVLLILAGVTIVTLTGDNGLLQKAGEASEKNDIGTEKEQIALAYATMKLEDETDISKREEIFQNHLDKYTGEGKTEVYGSDSSYTIHFLGTNRLYTVEEDGNIIEEDIAILREDNVAGAFDGTGTQSNPYIIMSIEDLVYFSKEVCNGNSYSGKYIELGKPLDFKSKFSYKDIETTYSYNEETTSYISDKNSDTILIKLCSEGIGFIPIGNNSKAFSGKFNGKGYKIKNVYINTSGYAGLFGYESRGHISDLKVNGKIISSDGNAGGIVGGAWNTDSDSIRNCDFKGSVEGDCTGGIVGSVPRNGWGAIQNCNNYGTVKGKSSAGGIAGNVASDTYIVKNCSNFGSVNAKISGGIVRRTWI